jgi:hypothetical protein
MPTKRDSIEEVKLDAARITQARIAADLETNPDSWSKYVPLAERSAAPTQPAQNEPKKEGK